MTPHDPSSPRHHHRTSQPAHVRVAVITVSDTRDLESDTGGALVVELLEEIARDMEAVTRKMTLNRLEMLPVTIHTKTRLVRMDGDEGIVSDARNGAERSIGHFDSVLVAIGHEARDALSGKLVAAGLPVTVIGDAREPRQIFDATQEGRDAIEAILRANSETFIAVVNTIASTSVDGG